MGVIIPRKALLFITVLVLLCYSIQLTSGGWVTKAAKVIGKINKAFDCKPCYIPCKTGCKKFFKKTDSSSQFDSCVRVCKKTCKCEL